MLQSNVTRFLESSQGPFEPPLRSMPKDDNQGREHTEGCKANSGCARHVQQGGDTMAVEHDFSQASLATSLSTANLFKHYLRTKLQTATS
jgi:hypothetical protein